MNMEVKVAGALLLLSMLLMLSVSAVTADAAQTATVKYPLCAKKEYILAGIGLVKSALLGFVFIGVFMIILSELFGLFSRAISFISPNFMSGIIGLLLVYMLVFSGFNDSFITTVPGTNCATFSDAIWYDGPPLFRLFGFALKALGLALHKAILV